MKKYFTLPNILACLAFALGIAGFCMMFTDQLYYLITSIAGNAKVYIPYSNVFFDSDGTIVGFIGYIIIAVAAIAACIISCPHFVKDLKVRRIIIFCLAVLSVIGAILVLIQSAVINGRGYSGTISIGSYNIVNASFYLAIGPILGGAFGILSGLASCCSVFTADK